MEQASSYCRGSMDLHQIWFLIGGNALATALVALIFKLWTTHSFDKRLAEFTKEIEGRNAAKLEILRLSLGKELHTFSARNTILAEKHAEVLAQLYYNLWEISRNIPRPLKQELAEKEYSVFIWGLVSEASEYLAKNRVFLDQKLADAIVALLHLLIDEIGEYTAARKLPDTEEALITFMDMIIPFRNEVDSLLKELEHAFRKTLRGED